MSKEQERKLEQLNEYIKRAYPSGKINELLTEVLKIKMKPEYKSLEEIELGSRLTTQLVKHYYFGFFIGILFSVVVYFTFSNLTNLIK